MDSKHYSFTNELYNLGQVIEANGTNYLLITKRPDQMVYMVSSVLKFYGF